MLMPYSDDDAGLWECLSNYIEREAILRFLRNGRHSTLLFFDSHDFQLHFRQVSGPVRGKIHLTFTRYETILHVPLDDSTD